MFCTQCGARNDESALHCTQCGASLREPQPEPQVEPQEDPESMATRRLTIADLGFMNLPPASPAAPAAADPSAPPSAGGTSAGFPTYGSVPLSTPPGTSRISPASAAIPAPPAPAYPSASTPMPPPVEPFAPTTPTAPTAYAPPSDPPYVPVENQFGMPAQTVPNYMVQSILLTLCCCLPFGVVAIVFASQVNSKLAAGDVNGAIEASGKSRLFCWIGLAAGLAFFLFLGVFKGLAAFRMMHH